MDNITCKMFGIFIFKANPDDKNYPYKKDPKQPLKLSDEELVHFVKTSHRMTYFCHHKDDYDKMTDEEKVLSMKQYWDNDYSHMKKMRSIDNGYHTEDGNFYIKVITKNKDWFSRYFN